MGVRGLFSRSRSSPRIPSSGCVAHPAVYLGVSVFFTLFPRIRSSRFAPCWARSTIKAVASNPRPPSISVGRAALFAPALACLCIGGLEIDVLAGHGRGFATDRRPVGVFFTPTVRGPLTCTPRFASHRPVIRGIPLPRPLRAPGPIRVAGPSQIRSTLWPVSFARHLPRGGGTQTDGAPLSPTALPSHLPVRRNPAVPANPGPTSAHWWSRPDCRVTLRIVGPVFLGENSLAGAALLPLASLSSRRIPTGLAWWHDFNFAIFTRRRLKASAGDRPVAGAWDHAPAGKGFGPNAGWNFFRCSGPSSSPAGNPHQAVPPAWTVPVARSCWLLVWRPEIVGLGVISYGRVTWFPCRWFVVLDDQRTRLGRLAARLLRLALTPWRCPPCRVPDSRHHGAARVCLPAPHGSCGGRRANRVFALCRRRGVVTGVPRPPGHTAARAARPWFGRDHPQPTWNRRRSPLRGAKPPPRPRRGPSVISSPDWLLARDAAPLLQAAATSSAVGPTHCPLRFDGGRRAAGAGSSW